MFTFARWPACHTTPIQHIQGHKQCYFVLKTLIIPSVISTTYLLNTASGMANINKTSIHTMSSLLPQRLVVFGQRPVQCCQPATASLLGRNTTRTDARSGNITRCSLISSYHTPPLGYSCFSCGD